MSDLHPDDPRARLRRANHAAAEERAALQARIAELEAEVERLRASPPARVRMDPQPAIYSRRRMVPNTAGVVLKLGGFWAKVSPRPQFDPVRDPDGTWYWELRPAAQGEEGKP